MSIPRRTEQGYQRAILRLAGLLGWRYCHFRAARTLHGWRTPVEGDAGFPDLVLCRPPRLILAEIKSARGRYSPAQRAWLDVLSGVPGVEVCEWRDGQTTLEEIREILTGTCLLPASTPRGSDDARQNRDLRQPG